VGREEGTWEGEKVGGSVGIGSVGDAVGYAVGLRKLLSKLVLLLISKMVSISSAPLVMIRTLNGCGSCVGGLLALDTNFNLKFLKETVLQF
jgi:hypothetical protein